MNEQPENLQSENPSRPWDKAVSRPDSDSNKGNTGKGDGSSMNMTPEEHARMNVGKTRPAPTTKGKPGSST
jgi:hypothetical protein